MKTFAFLLFVFFALNSVSQTKSSNVTVIDGFENKASIDNWEGTFEISASNPSHGKYSMMLTSASGTSLWLESKKIPADWSGFQTLKFDVYNPSENLYYGNLQIFDDLATDEEAELKGQSYRGQKLFLNSGWNHFEFLVQNAKVEEGDRYLAINKIRRIRFAFGNIRHPLYFDNIRLVSGQESMETLSDIQPSHKIGRASWRERV